jgi:hypothetical protein
MGAFAGTLKNRRGRRVLAGEVRGEIDAEAGPRPPLVEHAASGWFSADISAVRWDLSNGPPALLVIPGLGDVIIDLISEVFVGSGCSIYRFEGRIEQEPRRAAHREPFRACARILRKWADEIEMMDPERA